MKPSPRPARPYLRIALGIALVASFIWITVGSYQMPTYNFGSATNLLCASILGVMLTMLWRGRIIKPVAWLLPVSLIMIAFVSYGATSRDWLRYLFDGEMIRLFHMSPYVHLPTEFPIDQYSSQFIYIWWVQIGSPYGPLWEGLMKVINFISSNQLAGGLIALKIVNFAGLIVAARYIYLITKRPWASFIFLINPVVLLDSVATPHPDIVIAAGILAAFYHQRAPIRGGLIAAMGLIKIHALILMPFFSRRPRDFWRTGLWTAAFLVVITIILKSFVGFDWLPMLRAGQAGAVTGQISLLMYNILPGAPARTIILASYGLFIVGYGAILVAFWRHKIMPLTAITLATLLVPLCLTGVLLPWHFILPIAFMLTSQRLIAYWGVLFITLIVLKGTMTVFLILALLSIIVGCGYVFYRLYLKLEHPPKAMRKIVGLLS